MRTITRRIPAVTIKLYQCEICKTKYRSKAKALKCNSLGIENNPSLKLGDRVMWREQRFCQNRQKHYWMSGKIVRILGLTLADEEYNAKWLGGSLSNLHVRMYQVRWTCPHCNEKREGRFYSPELKKLSGRK